MKGNVLDIYEVGDLFLLNTLPAMVNLLFLDGFPAYQSYQTKSWHFFTENVDGKRCYWTFASLLAHRNTHKLQSLRAPICKIVLNDIIQGN